MSSARVALDDNVVTKIEMIVNGEVIELDSCTFTTVSDVVIDGAVNGKVPWERRVTTGEPEIATEPQGAEKVVGGTGCTCETVQGDTQFRFGVGDCPLHGSR